MKNPMQIKICQRSAPVWLMNVLQIRRTIPYNARKAVAEVRKIEAGKGVTKREDMEKAFPPVLSDFNFVVVAGCGPVKMPPVYAFKTPISPPFQDFPGMVGGHTGQIIQSPPERASKCVEENP